MNILLYDSSSYIQKDLIFYLEKYGHHCKNLMYKLTDTYQDTFFEDWFSYYLQNYQWDCVISANFYPIIAKICHRNNIKYISWIYDSPMDKSHMEYFQFDTNFCFVFDRIDADVLIQKGAVHIYHLPLAVNTQRLSRITPDKSDYETYSSDISFVGQFYNNTLRQLLTCQEPYDIGYIDSIVQTQLQIYGYNFIDSLITEDLLNRLNNKLLGNITTSPKLTREGLYQSIAKEITHIERRVLCNILGQLYDFHYYSNEKQESLNHLYYGGTAYYYTEMPKIFKLSRLNLNPTLKTIQSGIPLRVLDILGCGGALLCNCQPEILEYFEPEKDIILYDSIEDAIAKAEYYLAHDDERNHIAANGYQKVAEQFSYPERLSYMFKTAGLCN